MNIETVLLLPEDPMAQALSQHSHAGGKRVLQM